MKTDTEYAYAAPLVANSQPTRGNTHEPSQSFADMLSAKVEARRNEILDSQPAKAANPNAEDIATIKEHGLRHYAEEMHKKKMEELREKILEKMGLTEEDLEAMPAAQRKNIEDMIAREIEARMAVNSLTNGGDDASSPNAKTGLLAAQVVAGETGHVSGGAAGLAVMAAIDAKNATKEGDGEAAQTGYEHLLGAANRHPFDTE